MNYLFFLPIITIVVVYYLYYKLTLFKKKILISYKYKKSLGENNYYIIIDEKNIKYYIGNSIWNLNSNDDLIYGMFEDGAEYIIKGYGLNIPLLNLYPIILAIDYKTEK